jgi:hypothetical protein
MLNTARTTPGWYHSHLTAADCQVLSAEALRKARNELKDDSLFRQEFFTSFTVPLQGAYYQKQFKTLHKGNKVTELPIESGLLTTTAWDLGIDDHTAIWFMQETRGGEVRIVDYYQNKDESMQHYIRYVKEWGERHDVLFKEHLAPHDINVREYSTGESRLSAARKLGLRFRAVERHLVEDGINCTRDYLSKCLFDLVRCKEGVNALKSYTKKWDEEKQTYGSRPERNWATHGADAFRYLAMGQRRTVKPKKKSEMVAQTDYDIFA